MASMINRWINSIPLKSILEGESKYYMSTLTAINDLMLFEYLNAFGVYFDVVNLGFRRYLELNGDFNAAEFERRKLDTNFLYYLELGTRLPNLVYLVSMGVSRESAIYLWLNKFIRSDNGGSDSREYFAKNKTALLDALLKRGKNMIKKELEAYVYSASA